MADKKTDNSNASSGIKTLANTTPTAPKLFENYDIALIHGIKKKPELNKHHALIKGYSAKKKRYHVSLSTIYLQDTLNILLKPDNLKIIYPVKWTKISQNVFGNIQCFICKTPIPNISDIVSCKYCLVPYYCSNNCMHQHRELTGNHPDPHYNPLCSINHVSILKEYEMINYRFNFFKFDVFDHKLQIDDYWMKTTLYSDYKTEQAKQFRTFAMDIIENFRYLKTWQSWYNFHKIPYTLPIALRYHYQMSVYYVLYQNRIRYRPPAPKSNANDNDNDDDNKDNSDNDKENDIIIHLICVNQRLIDLENEWNEIALLIPGMTFKLICFGSNISTQRIHKIYDTVINIYYYPCIYTKKNIKKYVEPSLQIPKFIIGLNAGLGEYNNNYKGSLTKTIKYIIKTKIPAYFTEYSLRLALNNCKKLIGRYGGIVVNVQHNPFMAPYVSFNKNERLQTISNNVMYSINTKPNARK